MGSHPIKGTDPEGSVFSVLANAGYRQPRNLCHLRGALSLRAEVGHDGTPGAPHEKFKGTCRCLSVGHEDLPLLDLPGPC
jgi:hypothetical protein